MGSSEKTTQSWSTHDIACTHCRERKIRCGRERPQCANCKRDGVECEYSTPGKRVNHIKLLCNNIGGLEDRLSNIEGELSALTTLLKAAGNPGALTAPSATGKDSSKDFSVEDQPAEDRSPSPPRDRHIVRCPGDSIDRYHGPCTLFALCNEFCNTNLSAERSDSPSSVNDDLYQIHKQGRVAKMEAAKDLIARMCLEAAIEEPFDLQSDHITIRLPPKQFLLMVQTQCMQQADYATDIFVQSSFWATVERIYSRPFTPADEAWAICFNTIILLFLGSEISAQGNDPLVGSQFALPFLLTVRTALSNPRVLMAPKLINVQALALLSIAAQIYYPPGFTESIFAQACVLARTMGLHQRHAVSDGVGPEEAQERFKVFRSLYLRDKSFSISRGSICWLPSFDCSLSSDLGQMSFSDSTCTARIQLAKLQEDIYRLFHSAESENQSSAKHKSALARIEQGLERWTNEHDVFSSPCSGGRDADLQLEFLAARISAFRGSSDPNHMRRALNDARASCLLLLISSGKQDQQYVVQRPEALTASRNTSKPLGRTGSSRSNKNKNSTKDSSISASRPHASDSIPIFFHSLLDTFSVPAFFLLVKNVLWPISPEDDSQTEEDINLLRKACACYKELDSRIQANNHTRKVGRAFERLLEVVNVIKNPHQLQTSPHSTRSGSKTHTPPNSQNVFGVSQGLSEFPDLSTSSAYPMPAMSWDSFSTRDLSNLTTETTSPVASPQLMTPMETEFFTQHFQQQIMSPSSKKRPRLGEADLSTDDYSGSRLISDFLATSPMMSFDIGSQDEITTAVF